MERKPLNPYQQNNPYKGGVPTGASSSGSDNISEKIASKFIKGKSESSQTNCSGVHVDSVESAQKQTLETRKKTESKVTINKTNTQSSSDTDAIRPITSSHNKKQPTKGEHFIQSVDKKTTSVFSRPTEQTNVGVNPYKGNPSSGGAVTPIKQSKLKIAPDGSVSSVGTITPIKQGKLKVTPDGSVADDKYKVNIYTYERLQQQAKEKKQQQAKEKKAMASTHEEAEGNIPMPTKGCVKNSNHLANPLASLGHIAAGVVVHPTNAYSTHQTVSRYTHAAKNVTIGALDMIGGMANRTAFRKDLKGSRIKNRLHAAGIDARILQKQSVFKNKDGKDKKKLSNKDLKLIERSLVTSFRGGSLHNTDLSKMSDHELNKAIRKLEGKDKELAKAYRDIRRARRVTLSKAGRAKAVVKGGRARQSLTSLITLQLYQSEVGQGARLTQRYVRTAKSSITFAAKTYRLGKTVARRLVKPYNIHVRKREIKKIERNDRRTHKKQARRTKRINKRTERIKAVRKKVVAPAKRHVKTSKIGKSVRRTRIRVHYSKPATTLRHAKRKLKPVAQAGNKATGLLAKGLGKLTNITKAIVNLDETVKHLLFMALGGLLIVLMIPVLGMAAIVSVLNLLPTSSTSEKYHNKPAIEVVADKVKEKDEEWFQNLQNVSKNTSAVHANGGKKVYGGDNPLTGKRISLSLDDDTSVTYKFYNGFMFDLIHLPKSKFDKNKLDDKHSITPYSNLHAIGCAGNIYRNSTGCSEDEYVEYCMQLYDHTHIYQTGVGDPHFCPAGNCKKISILCTDTAKIKQIKKSHTAKYYEDKKKNKDCTYEYLVKNIEKNNHDGKGCISYYCTDKDVAANAKKCKPVEYLGKDKKGFTTYCDFTKDCEEKEVITYKDIPNVDEKAYKKDHNGDGKPDGYYVDTADSSFQYDSDLFNKDMLMQSLPGTDYKDCAYAKNILTLNVGVEKLNAALGKEITVVTGTRTYENKKYYLGYCKNLSSFVSEEKKMDGYFLLTQKKNAKGKTVYSIATKKNTGKPMYFIACQGHRVKKRTFHYCEEKHYGCKGHTIAYCPGHVSLEIYACIAGYDSDEAKAKKAKNNILYADNVFYKNTVKGLDFEIGTYAKKWSGYKDADCSWLETMLSLDWLQNYNLNPKNYMADALKKLSS